MLNTKWKSLFLLLLMTTFSATVAQIRIAPAVSINLSEISFDPVLTDATQELRNGFGVGAVISIPLQESLRLQFEPMYMQRGAVLGIRQGTGEEALLINQTIALNYLDLPVLLQIFFSDLQIRPYLLAGQGIGYLQSATLNVDGATINGEPADIETSSRDIKDDLRKIDITLNAGLGLSISLEAGDIFLEALFNYGLRNIFETNVDSKASSINRGLSFKAGFAFLIGGD